MARQKRRNAFCLALAVCSASTVLIDTAIARPDDGETLLSSGGSINCGAILSRFGSETLWRSVTLVLCLYKTPELAGMHNSDELYG